MLNKGLFSSNSDMWATPQALFDNLNNEFHFTLDPCAVKENAKCDLFYSPEQDGLMQNWGGAHCILQPSLWQINKQMGGKVC